MSRVAPAPAAPAARAAPERGRSMTRDELLVERVKSALAARG